MLSFDVKDMFFDSPKVINLMDAATRQALAKAGAFIRKTARQSMPRRKGASAPGKPPNAHRGDLKTKLYFSLDRNTRSLVVGPVKLGSSNLVPNVLEFGGDSTRFGRQKKEVPVKIAPRPFMGPALEEELPNLPSRWGDSSSRWG